MLAKIQHFSCMTIASLDIDGFRIDKALQVTVDAQGVRCVMIVSDLRR